MGVELIKLNWNPAFNDDSQESALSLECYFIDILLIHQDQIDLARTMVRASSQLQEAQACTTERSLL